MEARIFSNKDNNRQMAVVYCKQEDVLIVKAKLSAKLGGEWIMLDTLMDMEAVVFNEEYEFDQTTRDSYCTSLIEL